ncbi:MAG: hypothetical protein WC959_09720 [Kiritimatiellales bacterium]
MKKTGLIVLLVLLVKFVNASVIYQDDFNGPRKELLNGAAPDVRPGSEVWATDNRNFDYSWKRNGSAYGNSPANSSAALPFTVETGKIYTLTADFTLENFNPSNPGWAGISFCTSGDQLEYAPDKNSFARLYAQRNGNVTAAQSGWHERASLFSGGDVKLSIVLKTTGEQWDLEYWLDGSLFASSAVSAIAESGSTLYIKFGLYRTVGKVSCKNLVLSVDGL